MHSYPQSKESVEDDDASIIRVCGFALHSAISLCKKALQKNQQHKHSQILLQQCSIELEILEKIKAEDKTFLPQVIKFQDRGKMTFMHSSMLPFGKTIFTAVKPHLNYDKYIEYGSDVFAQTHEYMLQDTAVFSAFKSCISHLCGPVEESVIKTVYMALLTKIVNTIGNSFNKYFTT